MNQLRLEVERASEARVIKEKYKIRMQMNFIDILETKFLQPTDALKSIQVAAQQVILEELPLIISTFIHSTTAAVYSNVKKCSMLKDTKRKGHRPG